MDNKKIHSGKSNSGQKPLWLKVAFVINFIAIGFSFLLFAGQLGTISYLKEFSILNSTDENLIVTPVGTVQNSERKAALPIHEWKIIPVYSSKTGMYELFPGEKLTLLYDSDDIQLSEIVVYSINGGASRQLDVKRNAAGKKQSLKDKDVVVIESFDSLGDVSEPVRNASIEAMQDFDIQFHLNCIMIFPLVSLGLLFFLSKWF